MEIEDNSTGSSLLTDKEKARAGGYPSVKAYRRATRKRAKQQTTVVDSLASDVPPPQKNQRKTASRALPLVFFGIPMLLIALYLFLFAADRYVSESKIFVARVVATDGGENSNGGIFSGASVKPTEDLLYLKEYIHSLDMLLALDQRLNLHAAFAIPTSDFWYRLSEDATQEQFLAYYRSRVQIAIDNEASILTVTTEGFTPEKAQSLNQAILDECENLINRLSQKLVEQHLVFARREVEHNRNKLEVERNALLVLQNSSGVIDPIVQADAAGKMISELETKRAQLQAELRHAQTYLSAQAMPVIEARGTIAALESQIELERSKLAGSADNEAISTLIVQYEQAKAQVEFSADVYRRSLSALDSARAEAIRKLKSVAVVVSPQLPEEPMQPQKLTILGTLLLILGLLYGLLKLLWAVVNDHRLDAS